MGRFQLVHDELDDVDEQSKQWEFVAANEGEEKALVPSESHHNNQATATTRRIPTGPAGTTNVYFVWDHSELAQPVGRQRTRRQMTVLVIWVATFLVAFVAWWVRDGPPAPPTHAGATMLSWNEYWKHHFQQLYQATTALAVHAPLHIAKWWILTTYVDLKLRWQQHSSSHTRRNNNDCALRIPHNLHVHNNISLVGQAHAVDLVRTTLQAWNSSRTQPRLVLLLGQASTGKRTLVGQMAPLLSNCSTVVELSGHDFQLSYGLNTQSLVRQLIHAILMQPLPIVVLRDVDKLEPTVLTAFVQQLTSDSSTGLHEDDESHVVSSIRDQFHNRLVFLTSSAIGVKSIAKHWYRNVSNAQISSSLLLDLAYDVNTYYGTPLSSKLDAIVPLFPLGPEEIAAIFRLMIQRYSQEQEGVLWKNLHVTEAAVQLWTMPPVVEYLSWQRDGGPTRVVSSAGASIVGDRSWVAQTIRAHVQQCLKPQQPTLRVAVLDASWNTAVLKWCNDDDQKGCEQVCQFAV